MELYRYKAVDADGRLQRGQADAVNRVGATSPEGRSLEMAPFYSFKHSSGREQQRAFWHTARRRASESEPPADEFSPNEAAVTDHGTEVYISLVDLDFNPTLPADWVVDVEATCLNRDLPHNLPFGGGQPRLSLPEGGGLVRPKCISAPTPTLRPPLAHGAMWRLVSHLGLNHLSIDQPEATDALREILSLYDFTDSAETRALIEGVDRVTSRRIVGRAGGAAGGFCRGVELTVRLDESRFAGSGAFLFASVLERFVGLYSSINSFSRLVATSRQREGELRRWPPRAGERTLL